MYSNLFIFNLCFLIKTKLSEHNFGYLRKFTVSLNALCELRNNVFSIYNLHNNCYST